MVRRFLPLPPPPAGDRGAGRLLADWLLGLAVILVAGAGIVSLARHGGAGGAPAHRSASGARAPRAPVALAPSAPAAATDPADPAEGMAQAFADAAAAYPVPGTRRSTAAAKTPPPSPPARVHPQPPAPPAAPGGELPPSPPVRIEIPAIRVSAPIDPMGLNPDGTLQIPRDFRRAGYYTGRPTPGEIGPAIIEGHVDSKRGPAVFYRLKDLQPGDRVFVTRADGIRAVFVIDRLEQHPKDAFPTDEVYGPVPEAGLRLITCGGSFNRRAGHYRDNVIVFAHMEA